MERGLTIKQALAKGKGKYCNADRCDQRSSNICERCAQPACKYHMCARVKNLKKIKICDKCNYAEIREQIDQENQKEKKQILEKLQSVEEKNSEAFNEALQDKQRIKELEQKYENFEIVNNTKNDLKLEEIRKEQYLKENNIDMLANLKAAIDNSTKNFAAENEKLAQVKSEVSATQMDVNQLHTKIRELETSIKTLKDQASNSISQEKVNLLFCPKCLDRLNGRSVLNSVAEGKGRKSEASEQACSKCQVF
jgi:DNA repair exonuclease SbcCD ATPase subunit